MLSGTAPNTISVMSHNVYTHRNLDNLILIYKYVLDFGFSIELKQCTSMPMTGILEYHFELTENNPNPNDKSELVSAYLRVNIP